MFSSVCVAQRHFKLFYCYCCLKKWTQVNIKMKARSEPEKSLSFRVETVTRLFKNAKMFACNLHAQFSCHNKK